MTQISGAVALQLLLVFTCLATTHSQFAFKHICYSVIFFYLEYS